MAKSSMLLLLLGALAGWVVQSSTTTVPVALGQTVDSAGGYTLATGRLQGKGEADCLYIFDHESKQLVVYFLQGKRLELYHSRDCKTDFSVRAFGEHYPHADWDPKNPKTWK